jgi:hypothetical protein
MAYTVITKAGITFTLPTALEAVDKALELIRERIHGVYIIDDQGRRYGPTDFPELLRSEDA